jgi:hypothetical protein
MEMMLAEVSGSPSWVRMASDQASWFVPVGVSFSAVAVGVRPALDSGDVAEAVGVALAVAVGLAVIVGLVVGLVVAMGVAVAGVAVAVGLAVAVACLR